MFQDKVEQLKGGRLLVFDRTSAAGDVGAVLAQLSWLGHHLLSSGAVFRLSSHLSLLMGFVGEEGVKVSLDLSPIDA